MKNYLRMALLSLLAVCLLSAPALAASDSPAWGCVQGQNAVLYLVGVENSEGITCQVGNQPVEVSGVSPIADLSTPLETVIMIDNSLSIREDHRGRAVEILQNLIESRMEGEKYTIITISDQVNYLCEGVEDYSALKSILQGVTFQLQNTQLTDGVYHVLEKYEKANDGLLRRLVLVADGCDDKQVGYTKEELSALIKKLGYPVYAIGCGSTDANSTEQMDNLLSLSRITDGSASFYLENVQDNGAVVSGLTAWNQCLRVDVPLPAEVCDGSKKMVQVTADSKNYVVELTMPFGQVVASAEPTPPPVQTVEVTPAPVPVEEPKGISTTLILVIVILAVVVIAAVVAVVLVVLKGKKKKEKKDSFEYLPQEMAAQVPYNGETELMGETMQGEKTALMWDETPSSCTLVLRDSSNPKRQFEVAVQGIIAVGRDSNICKIALGYEPTVSRHQCDIYMKDGHVMVRNISSANITYVNGQKVLEECELLNGSILKMGRAVMNVEIR